MLENNVIGLSPMKKSENLDIAIRATICIFFDRIRSFNGTGTKNSLQS